MQVTGIGSMLNFHFQRGTIRRAEDVWSTGEDAVRLDRLRTLFHLDMLAAGFYLSRRGFMSLSLPMTEREHAGLAAALDEFLTVRRSLLG